MSSAQLKRSGSFETASSTSFVPREAPSRVISPSYVDVSTLACASLNEFGSTFYDEEFAYLFLFRSKYRDDVARRLGRSPRVDSLFLEPATTAQNILGYVSSSSLDPSVLYIVPGSLSVWDSLKAFSNTQLEAVVGPRQSLEAPASRTPGFCYLIGFDFVCQKEAARRLGSYPTVGQLTGIDGLFRVQSTIQLTRSRGDIGPFHVEYAEQGVLFWDTMVKLSKNFHGVSVGSDSGDEAEQAKSIFDDFYDPPMSSVETFERPSTPPIGRPSPLIFSPVQTLSGVSPRLPTEPLSADEREFRHLLAEDGSPSQEVLGEVTCSFDRGYCYLGLFAPSLREEAKKFFGPNPKITRLLRTEAPERYPAVGVVSATPSGPSTHHVSFETRGIDVWRELEFLSLESLEYTLGAPELGHKRTTSDIVVEEEDTPFVTLVEQRVCSAGVRTLVSKALKTTGQLVLPVCLLVYCLRAIAFDRAQVIATLCFIFLAVLSAAFLDSMRTNIFKSVIRLMPLGMGELATVFVELAVGWHTKSYTIMILQVFAFIVRSLALTIAIWRNFSQVSQFRDTLWTILSDSIGSLLDAIGRFKDARTFQAASDPVDKVFKVAVNFIAGCVRVYALSLGPGPYKKRMEKLALSLASVARAADTPAAAKDLWSFVNEDVRDPPAYEPAAYSADLDISGSIIEPCELASLSSLETDDGCRSFQSGDEFPEMHCKHIVTKGNIESIVSKVGECERGSIHIITAATGTGKSTAIPYFLSTRDSKPVYVVIPTIAAAESSASVIKARFGVTPNLQADSKFTPGDCNVWVVTAKTFVSKLLFNPKSLYDLGAVIFDEMHVNSAENDLFRKVSPRLALRYDVLWASATFAQSFTLPGDLSHPVVERIDSSVTLRNVFTSKCKVRGVTPDTIRGRYIVFCASMRDTEIVKAKFKGSTISAFAISSSNYSVVIPQVERALRDKAISTVVVATTPVLETGVTLPFNYCVDLAEQVVPSMTYDPCALSTKRVAVTKGQATQRKGRVGRLFRGVYIAPVVKYTPTTSISESDLSLAHLYSRLFNYPSPSRKSFPFLDEQRLTDAFINNVMSTRMDPIAVAGMSTPEGRIFKSFASFEFPRGADKKRMVFSEAYFPESVWRSWPQFETSLWEQYLEDQQRTQTGTSVRAPFWDYTTDDKLQIENWQLKVSCYKGTSITDAQYNDPVHMKTEAATRLKASWVCAGSRTYQSLFASSAKSGSCVSPRRQRCFEADAVNPEERRARAFGSVPVQVLSNTLRDAPGTYLFVVLATLLCLALYYYAVYRAAGVLVKQVSKRFSRVDKCVEPEVRVLEKETAPIRWNPSDNPNRPFESKKRRFMPYSYDDKGDDFVSVAFGNEQSSRKVRYDDLDRELDTYFNDFERNGASWADDCVTVSGTRSNGQTWSMDMYESARVPRRTQESALHSRTPNFSLKAVKSSVVSLGPAGSSTHCGYGTIIRGYIFVNTHVLNACGKKLHMVSQRGLFEFTPVTVLDEADLTVIQLPSGISGTSQNLVFRTPEDGERVVLVRSTPQKAEAAEPTPSEESFTARDEQGLVSYIINTLPGDCGTPVIGVKDGALVGIHSMGGAITDQANFCAPLSPRVVAELHKRTPQRAFDEVINFPGAYSPDDLNLTARVEATEQLRRPVTQLMDVQKGSRFGTTAGGFVDLAFMKRHISKRSKIVVDKQACEVFFEDRPKALANILDYMPSALTSEAYWKDVSKYQRSPQLLPSDFTAVVLDFFREMSPWIFEQQPLIPVDQVYYEVDKQKSSGPRLSGKKSRYMSDLNGKSFVDLVHSCESLYDVPVSEFVPPIWQVSIKDEIRDTDRVKMGKTRTFMSAPIETILGNMRIVSAFNERFVDHCLDFPSTMGIDKFRGGWNDLANYLGTQDRIYSSGDGARFDSSVSVTHMGISQLLRCASVAPKYRRHIKNLYTETIYTPLVMEDGVIRMKVTGNPSGSLNTGIDNSIALQAGVYYALFLVLGREEALRALKARDIVFVVNGDDLGFSFSASWYVEGFLTKVTDALSTCGMTYAFTPPSKDIRDFVFLSHGFLPVTTQGRTIYIPVLDPARIVASCCYTRKTDAVSTYSRYAAALVHAYPHPRLYPYVLRLVREFLRSAMIDRHFIDPGYAKFFPIFDSVRIRELYGIGKVGSAGENNPHKNFESIYGPRNRTYQMAPLEVEHGETPDDDAFSVHEPLREAGASDDIVTRPKFSAPSRDVKFDFTRGMDSTIGSVFSGVVSKAPRNRIVVAKSTRGHVERSVSALRDLFNIDDESDMQSLLCDLLIYYGDNSTSERNPHVFPYDWKDREFSFHDIDRCLLPTPRKFWRASAEVTRKYLEHHPDLTFHWAEMHGFPAKYREFGFDCGDYCKDIPDEARLAIQAAKDASLTRSPYNLMRADLKAVGFGGGTVVEQITGSQFGARGPGKGQH